MMRQEDNRPHVLDLAALIALAVLAAHVEGSPAQLT
jgi:hypothetical protein